MTAPRPLAARLAMWWVQSYTRTAPEPDGADRRAEVHADLHDEISDARARQTPHLKVSTAVLGRVLRGVPADLSWRFDTEREPGRLDWHLTHPGTLLAGLFALLVPTTVLADAGRGPAPGLATSVGALAAVVALLSSLVVCVGIVAAVRRTASCLLLPSNVTAASTRRGCMSAMCFLWACAALWRFAPGPLGSLSSATWAAFGCALLGYGASALAPAFRSVGLTVRKISS